MSQENKPKHSTHDYLRVVISKFKAGKVDHWRDYRFFGIDGKCWFAYPRDEIIEFFDESPEQSGNTNATSECL